MTEPTAELMLEILRRMQADLADLKEGQRTANVRLSAIEHHMAGFLASGVAQHDELERLKARVARIERRLDLADATEPPNPL
jgi:hypothetical protein